MSKLASGGCPIPGLDSRSLLEIRLGHWLLSGASARVAAMVAVLGVKSCFDALAGCYGDLAARIFAVETGLGADPAREPGKLRT